MEGVLVRVTRGMETRGLKVAGLEAVVEVGKGVGLEDEILEDGEMFGNCLLYRKANAGVSDQR